MGLLDLIRRDKKSTTNNPQIQQMQNMQFQGQQPGIPRGPQPNPGMQQFPNQQPMMTQPPQGMQFQQPVPQQRQPLYDRQLAQIPVDPIPVQNDYGYGDPQIPQPVMQNQMPGFQPNQPMQAYDPLQNPVPAVVQAEPVFEQIPAPAQSISTEDMSRKLEQVVPSPYAAANEMSENQPDTNQQSIPQDFSNIPIPDFSNFSIPEITDTKDSQGTLAITEEQPAPETDVMPPENLEIIPVTENPEPALDIPAEEITEPAAVIQHGNQPEVLIGTEQSDVLPTADISEPKEVVQSENNSDSLPPAEAPKFDLSNLDLSNLDLSKINLNPLPAEPVSEEESEEALPIAENVDTTVQTAVEELPANQSKKKLLFKKIGFFGLNGPNSQDIPAEAVSNLIKRLVEKDIEIIIDSKNGIGETVISKLADLKKTYTGVYLTPLMSDKAEAVNESIINKEGSAVLYSSYIERLRHLAKEPRLHVFFDAGGLANTTLFLSLWSIASLYPDNHKPIVLVGQNWKNFVNLLSQNGNIDENEMKVLTFVDSADQVLKTIENLNISFPSVTNTRPIRIVDRRVEGDESDFIVY